jgi:hypothetical protein
MVSHELTKLLCGGAIWRIRVPLEFWHLLPIVMGEIALHAHMVGERVVWMYLDVQRMKNLV